MFHLLRFFCESGKSDKIFRDHDGLISPPGEWEPLTKHGGLSAEIPRVWDFYSNYRSIVLLGPPRQGKTVEFEYQCAQVQHGFLLPLRDISDSNNLDEAIIDPQKWKTWLKSNEKGELFIDALDEAKIEAKNAINYLMKWVKRLGTNVRSRLRIHISCRHADWSRADQNRWFELFPLLPENGRSVQPHDENKSCVVLELLDLTRDEIQEFCRFKGIEPEHFLSALPHELLTLVARPQTLGFLLEDYARSPEKFPVGVQELYERIIEKRLQEHNEIYERAGIPQVGPAAKRSIAEHYALTCILTGREIIAPKHADSANEVPGELSGHGMIEEVETFKTDLFQVYNHSRFRFNEPELAEYLAAKTLNQLINENVIQPRKAVSLFFSSQFSVYPVPMLRRTLVWLSALNSIFRREVLQINPGLLIHDYIGGLTEEDKIVIWEWLVKEYADREWFDDREWLPHMGILACETLIPELKKVIENRDRYGRDLRILAIEIARQGNLTSLIPVISARIADFEENQLFLSEAGRTLVELDPKRKEDLKAWLDLPPTDQQDNQLLVQALEALWPEHIDLDTLIKHLRPQTDYFLIGRYRIFLKDLPTRLTKNQREQVLSAFTQELSKRIRDRKMSKDSAERDDKHFFPSDLLGDFLSMQLEEWDGDLESIPKIEAWLDTFDRAIKYGLLFEHEKAGSLKLHLENAHQLRQELCKQHILKYYGAGGDPKRFFWSAIQTLSPKKEDVIFWKGVLKNWAQEYPELIPAAWDSLLMAWKAGDYVDGVIEWIADYSNKNQIINELWNRDRQCSLDSEHAKWERESAQRKKEEKEKHEKIVQDAFNNIEKIRSGDENWLVGLSNYSSKKTGGTFALTKSHVDPVEKVFGQKVSEAFLEGLIIYWHNAKLPKISEYYLTNSMPWSVILVLQAIDSWYGDNKVDWSTLSTSLKQTALQAGLSELNAFPHWYPDLVKKEESSSRELWLEILELEKDSTIEYPHLANLLFYNRDFEPCRNVGIEYLKSHPDIRIEVAKPLIKSALSENRSESILDFLQVQGIGRINIAKEKDGLIFLAAAWRYRAKDIWDWIEKNYLAVSENRANAFMRWILAIEEIHPDFHNDIWPAWAKEEVLLSMLPDFLALKLPELPHEGTVTGPMQTRFLLNDCLNKIAESGSIKVIRGIISLLNRPDMTRHRNLLLHILERCRKANPRDVWVPLSPKELWEFIERDKRPVRNHKELFDLALEIVNEIKADIQSGDVNLRAVFWRDDIPKKNRQKPRKEETFQIIIFDKIKNHPLTKKIFGFRDIKITGGNRPDIAIVCKNPKGEVIKVYIEMKRQCHDELITAIKEQLADKYLLDPEARFGIYLVGWFGKEYYGKSQRAIKDAIGEFPSGPERLELFLNKICDQVAAERDDIDAIRSVLINLEI